MSMSVHPENILRCMSDAHRKSLGREGMTKAEAEAAFIAKNEAQLQRQIIQMLNRHGIHVICSQTGKRTTTNIGTPDLLFTVPRRGSDIGTPCAWELKMKGNKPTKEQTETMLAMQANGWKCAVVYSYDDALGIFNAVNS